MPCESSQNPEGVSRLAFERERGGHGEATDDV
jgi:hypothetical protein